MVQLVQALRNSHGGLDVNGTNVLPVFLEQRNQEVDGQMDVLGQIVSRHGDVSDGNAETQDLYIDTFSLCRKSTSYTNIPSSSGT